MAVFSRSRSATTTPPPSARTNSRNAATDCPFESRRGGPPGAMPRSGSSRDMGDRHHLTRLVGWCWAGAGRGGISAAPSHDGQGGRGTVSCTSVGGGVGVTGRDGSPRREDVGEVVGDGLLELVV